MTKQNLDFIDNVFETEQNFSIENQRQRFTMSELNEEITNATENMNIVQKKNEDT